VSYYLIDNPPARSQYRNQRRADPSGVILLHSTESMADVNPPDAGAENVARFIRGRSEAGSYHGLADSDTTVDLIPPWMEAFHCGTHRLNHHSLGFSVAWEAHAMAGLEARYRSAALRHLAHLCAAGAKWLHAVHGITVPARRLTVQQAIDGIPGFATHGMLDPSRRSDPDNTHTGDAFPWDEFFSYYTAEMGDMPATTPPNDEDDDMAQKMAWLRAQPGDKTGHCYRICGTTATWFATHEEIQNAKFFGVEWAGGVEKNSMLDPIMWRSLAILNGPLQNVPRGLNDLLDDEGKILAAIEKIVAGGSDAAATAEAIVAEIGHKLGAAT